jgi:hypothetical protein
VNQGSGSFSEGMFGKIILGEATGATGNTTQDLGQKRHFE